MSKVYPMMGMKRHTLVNYLLPRMPDRDIGDRLQRTQLARRRLRLAMGSALGLVELGMVNRQCDAASDHLQELHILPGKLARTCAIYVDDPAYLTRDREGHADQ